MTERALLQAIRDHPDDDLSRLAHADWLEEQDTAASRARAEFIRVQIERERRPQDDDRQADLEARERRLLIAHGRSWQPEGHTLTFARGYPESAFVSARWLEKLPKPFDLLPVRKIGVGYFYEGFSREKVQKNRFLARIESLALSASRSESVDPDDLFAVLDSQHLTGLRELDVGGNGFGDGLVARLFEHPAVQGLEALHVAGNNLTGPAVTALVRRPWPRLRSLSLGGNPLALSALQTLFSSDLWAQLHEIELGPLSLQTDEIPGFTDALRRTQARKLNLNGFCSTDAAVRALCEAKRWGEHLTDLRLAYTPGPLERLLRCAGLAGLSHLTLPEVKMTPRLWDLFAGCPHLANLRRLALPPRQEGGLAALARSPHVTRLHWLQGWDSEENVIAFVRSPNAAHVRWLNAGNDLTNQIARAMAGSPHLRCLTTLHANSSRLTGPGAVQLAASPHLVNLTFMDLLGCKLGARGQQALLENERLGWVGFSDDDVNKPELKDLHQRRYQGHFWGYSLDAGSPYER